MNAGQDVDRRELVEKGVDPVEDPGHGSASCTDRNPLARIPGARTP